MPTYKHPHPETSSETELVEHHDQHCTVLCELEAAGRDSELGRMFRVRFDDGFESDVFEDEIDRAIPRHVGGIHKQGARSTCPFCHA